MTDPVAPEPMNQDYPVPPPELLEEWEAEVAHTTQDEIWHVAKRAAQWGANQELKACCEWLDDTLLESTSGLSKLLSYDRRGNATHAAVEEFLGEAACDDLLEGADECSLEDDDDLLEGADEE